MSAFLNITRRFVRDDEGATLIEYGMMVLLITVLSITFIKTIGTKVSAGFNTVSTTLP